MDLKQGDLKQPDLCRLQMPAWRALPADQRTDCGVVLPQGTYRGLSETRQVEADLPSCDNLLQLLMFCRLTNAVGGDIL